MASNIDTKSVVGIVAVMIVGLALSPTLISLVSGAQPYDYTTNQTLNSNFSDNIGDVPSNWDNAVTDNSIATYENVAGNWVVSDNTDNGTCEWYQSLVVSSLSDGVFSASINAKYQLSDNSNLENLQIKLWLDDGTDNNLIFFVDNTLHAADNDVWYTVDNNIASYITATGTYYLRLWDNTERGNPVDNYISVRWDDSSLTIVTKTKTFTSMMVLHT